MKRIIIIIMSITMIMSSCTILTGCEDEGVTASPVGVWESPVNHFQSFFLLEAMTITISDQNIVMEDKNESDSESMTSGYIAITDGKYTYLTLDEDKEVCLVMINNDMLAVFSIYDPEEESNYKHELPNGVVIDAEASMVSVYFRQGSETTVIPIKVKKLLKKHFPGCEDFKYYPSSEILAIHAAGDLYCFFVANGKLTYIESLSLANLPQAQYEEDDIFTKRGYVITDCT